MACKSGSRSRWLLKACKAVLLSLALAAPAAQAKNSEGTPAETAQIIDRTTIGLAVALERPGLGLAQGTPLILAVTVNGMDHGMAQFRMIDDRLWAARSVLRDLGLKVGGMNEPADDLLALSEALGPDVSYDASLQSINLMVETEKLAVGTSRLNFNDQDLPVAQSATGTLLNYDFYANYFGGRVAFDGFAEARLFSGNALIQNTMFLRVGQDSAVASNAVVRLDTSAAISFPEKRLTLRAGDIITRSTSWSRPTRIGGMRIGTDFALQPYLVTAPIPTFFGQANLPSTVDLFIDGLKRYSGEVAPGPFEIGSGANRISGSGSAQVVVTDALGQVTTLDFPIYDTPTLLRKGLSDWSLEIGAVRKNYGIASFDYASELSASASWRRGLSDALTMEAHGEISASLLNGGVGATWRLPVGGVANGSVAASQHAGKAGFRAELGYSWTDTKFNLSATLQRASNDFADLASVHAASMPVERDLISLGYNTKNLGSFGASLIRQRHAGEERRSFANMSWQKTLGDRFSLSVSANLDLEKPSNRGAFLTLSFIPRQREQVSARFQVNERRNNAAIGYRRSLPYEGGFAWAVDASHDGDRLQAAAQGDYLGPHGQATVGARLIGGDVSGYAGYSGALVAMGGRVFASRKIFDGFAVVSTDGIADVPVQLHNREVGRTDASGNLLVTGLNAYQRNRVSIDPSDLPATLSVLKVTQEAVPSRQAGVVLNFSVAPNSSVLVTLVDDRGEELAVGLTARMEGADDQPLMVGFGGQLYIEQAKAGAKVTVDAGSGPCAFRLPSQLASQQAGRLGQMTCVNQ